MSNINLSSLVAPFKPSQVSWRVGATNKEKTKGLALAYVDARDVMERLDNACGPANWQCRYPHANGKTVCEVGIKIDGEWVWKADGAGDSDVEAEKGALSDAFKRAAVRWGIGRYLYDIASPWVEIEPAGKSFSIKQSEYQKLEKLLNGKAQPKQLEAAKPEAKRPEPQVDEWRDYSVRLAGLIKSYKSEKEIEDLLFAELKNLDGLLRERPKLHARLMEIRDERKSELKMKGAA